MTNLVLSAPTQPHNGHCPRCGVKAVAGALLCGCKDRPAEVTAQAFSTDATLKQKQDYYVYSERPYRMKEAPRLNHELEQALKRERLDKTYRFVWGGVVVVREEPNAPDFTIARGDRSACHSVAGVFMPKYIYARSRQARGYYYTDDLGRKIPTLREELVPPGRLALVDYRYTDFGILRWFLEQRTKAQDLIDAGVYDPKEQVPESEWVCIMPLETKLGLYYEPGLEMIEILQQREYENRNANLKNVAAAQMQRLAKARLEKEEAEDKQGAKDFDLVYRDAVRSTEKQTAYSI